MIKPFYQEALVTLYCGDSRKLLPEMPFADLCLTDPPYGINVTKKQMGLKRGKQPTMILGDWDHSRVDQELLALVRASAKHQIIWGANYYADLLPASRCWHVWYKRPGMRQISFADAELAWTSLRACVRVKPYTWSGFLTSGEKRWPHPTQKPVEVMKWCIEQVPTRPRLIIDPFAGSGSVLVAARELGIPAIGIELDERYCDISSQRLASIITRQHN